MHGPLNIKFECQIENMWPAGYDILAFMSYILVEEYQSFGVRCYLNVQCVADFSYEKKEAFSSENLFSTDEATRCQKLRQQNLKNQCNPPQKNETPPF
jgi:hypothetical protein